MFVSTFFSVRKEAVVVDLGKGCLRNRLLYNLISGFYKRKVIKAMLVSLRVSLVSEFLTPSLSLFKIV